MATLLFEFQGQPQEVTVGKQLTIGRQDDNDLCIPCQSISSHHAIITREGNVFQLRDRGSRNGVLVANRKVSFLILKDQAEFSLGDVTFVFRTGYAVERSIPTAAPSAPEPAPPAQAPREAPEPVSPSPNPEPAAPTVEPLETPHVPPPGANEPAPAPGRTVRPTIELEARRPAALQIPAEPASPPASAVAPAPPEPERGPATAATPEEVIARFKATRENILAEISKVIIGQRETLNQMLVALFGRGHCLLIGVPGLAKTLMVKTLGHTMELQSKRIQFTPDLMPSDITGTDILEEDSVTGKRNFWFHHGPLFTNLLLADEINRTPPKTQAALLEAMQEHRVTVSGNSYELPEPFMVLATQNPIEQEGTYPLPEAQLDRFMFCIHLSYPNANEEQQIILDTTREAQAPVSPVVRAGDVLELQRLVRQVPVSQHVALYALNLVRATRPNVEGSLDFVNRWVRWGAGTRAGQYLLLAAKAHVLLQGRFSVACADVREYALPVLRHRIFVNFTAASEGVGTDQIVKKLVEAVKEPKY